MLRKALLSAGVFLAFATGVTVYKSRVNDRKATQTHPPVGAFVNVDGAKVHYYKAGQGPVVILLHGAGGNLRDFTFNLAGKLQQHYTVLAFDRPGHGYTDTLNTDGESPEDQARILAAAARELGVDQAIIAGYSFGGAVALRWALDFPEMTRGLVLMSAVSNPWVTPPSYLYDLASNPITGPVFGATVSAFAPKALVLDTLSSLFSPQEPPDGYLDYIGAGLTMRKSSLRANGKQVSNLLPYIEDQSARYSAELTLPVEIIHGGQDQTVSHVIHSEVLARQLPHAEYVLREDLGHNTQHYAHQEIFAGLERILLQTETVLKD